MDPWNRFFLFRRTSGMLGNVWKNVGRVVECGQRGNVVREVGGCWKVFEGVDRRWGISPCEDKECDTSFLLFFSLDDDRFLEVSSRESSLKGML